MTGDPVATVIIVNYNGAHLLPTCLDALDAQRTDAVAFDTVVVDNASSDDSLQLLADKYPWVQVIASDVNTGFAGGNNLALRQLSSRYAVLLNNDATPEPGWLANLLAPFHSGDSRVAVVCGKVVFMPRFVRLAFATDGFRPGPHDGRDLGMRIHRVSADGADVTPKVLWESAAYGLERVGGQEYHWTRPDGEILIPVPIQRAPGGVLDGPLTISLTIAAEKTKPVLVNGVHSTVAQTPSEVEIVLATGTAAMDVINNAGGIVLRDGGYGADRGFQQIDSGQFGAAEEVFTACGNGMAIRADVGAAVDWFDDDFFMYYEDTDLSWRIRSRGYAIRYQPDAVLRHIHAASSKEWSPRWVYHVDRNRLLMLTKDASARMAAGAVVRYPLVAISMALRALVEMLRTRKRQALGPHVLRVRVFLAYLRLLPRMLRQRIAIGHAARVSRSELESWLTQR